MIPLLEKEGWRGAPGWSVRVNRLVAQDFQFDLVEQIVVEADPLQIEGDIGADAGIGEAFSDTFTVVPIRNLFPDIGKVVLVVRVLDVGQQLGALPH